jgi:hypothetical protein
LEKILQNAQNGSEKFVQNVENLGVDNLKGLWYNFPAAPVVFGVPLMGCNRIVT